MLPLVCNDAVAILFMFDLSRKSTLNSIKEWYRQARGFNRVSLVLFSLCLILLMIVFCWTQTAIPFLVGTKYDHFSTFAQEEQEEITRQVSSSIFFLARFQIYLNFDIVLIISFVGSTFRKSYESTFNFLFNFTFNQRSKDF